MRILLALVAMTLPAAAVEPDPNLTALCRELSTHVPRADVEYKPGVDAYGRPVAPADLSGGLGWQPPREFSFQVTINPIDYQRRRALEAARLEQANLRASASGAREALESASAVLSGHAALLRSAQAALAAEDAAVQAKFEAGARTIVNATGGANPTVAQLAARAPQLQQLEDNTYNDPSYLDLKERMALNEQARAENSAMAAENAAALAGNAADLEAVAADMAALDAEEAAIAGKGPKGELAVGTVTVRDGRAWIDGKPLDQPAHAVLEEACREAGLR